MLIVQARMGSTRLPGKVLKPLLGAPMLERQLERLERCRFIDQIVVATTKLKADDPIVALIERLDRFGYHRGPEHDVLTRYLEAAHKYGADVIVRVTADCPLIDPGVVDTAIDAYLRNRQKMSYVSNGFKRTYPRGLDVEVFPISALEATAQEAETLSDREHVTPFIWRQPERFPRIDVVDDEDNSDLRWTVDTPEDYALVTRIYEQLYPANQNFDYRDALRLVKANPELSLMNQHIDQKPV